MRTHAQTHLQIRLQYPYHRFLPHVKGKQKLINLYYLLFYIRANTLSLYAMAKLTIP